MSDKKSYGESLKELRGTIYETRFIPSKGCLKAMDKEVEQFDTGAVRDVHDDKPRIDLRSPYAAERVGKILRDGAKHYGERNWEKGIPISRCIASLERHLTAYKMGKRDEDHMAMVVANAEFILHFEEMIRMGLLPNKINDMPLYDCRSKAVLEKAVKGIFGNGQDKS